MKAPVLWTAVILLCSLTMCDCQKVCEITTPHAAVHELPGSPYTYAVEALQESISVNVSCKMVQTAGIVRLGVKSAAGYASDLLAFVDCPSTDTRCLLSFKVSLSSHQPYITHYIYLARKIVGSVRYGIQEKEAMSALLKFEAVNEGLLLVRVSNITGYPTPWVVTQSFQCDGRILTTTNIDSSFLVASLNLAGRRECTINITNGLDVTQISAVLQDIINAISASRTTLVTSMNPNREKETISIAVGTPLVFTSIGLIICLVIIIKWHRPYNICNIEQKRESAKVPVTNITLNVPGSANIQIGTNSGEIINSNLGEPRISKGVDDDDNGSGVFKPNKPTESLDSIVMDGPDLGNPNQDPEGPDALTCVGVLEDMPTDKMGELDQQRC